MEFHWLVLSLILHVGTQGYFCIKQTQVKIVQIVLMSQFLFFCFDFTQTLKVNKHIQSDP